METQFIGVDMARAGSEQTKYRVYLGEGIWWLISEREFHRLKALDRRRRTKFSVITGGRRGRPAPDTKEEG